jgi:glyoxylate reductase
MPKPNVFVTRLILEPGLAMVQAFCQAEVWQDELPPSRQVLLDNAGVDGLLCLLTDRIDGEVMDSVDRSSRSATMPGYDNIDIPAATQRRLPW